MNAGLFHWPARNPRAALAIGALLSLIAGLGVLHLHPDMSLQSLFSPNDPAARAMMRVLNDFSAAEEMLLLVTTNSPDPQPDQLQNFAGRLDDLIKHDPKYAALISNINYRADQQSRDLVSKVIAPNGIFYLSDADFESAKLRLTREQMADQFRRNEAMLAAPGPAAGALAKALLQDPLRLHEFIERRLTASRPFQTYQNSDAYLSPDGKSLLIRISGAKPPSDMTFCREITAAVTAAANQVNTDHMAMEFSGAYPIAAQSERRIRADSISTVIGSVASLAGLFILAFRRPLRLFTITFAPIALGVLWGFGVYALFSRTITPLTAIIGGVLAGIGIDYSIFYLVNYQERRAAGLTPALAAADTTKTIGGALLAAWVTSVVGFIAVGFASVRMLRDFSIVGSLGLAGAVLGAFFLLPAFLVLAEPNKTNKPTARLNIRPILHWIDQHARACLTTAIILLATALTYLLIAGPRLDLESDPTVMHPRPNPPLDAQLHIAQRMNSAPDSLIVYLQSDSPENLLTLAHHVNDRLATPAAQTAGVASTFGLASLLPDPAMVPARLQQTGPSYAAQVLSDFDAALAESSFSPDAFAPYKSFLKTLLTPTRAPGPADLLPYRQAAQALLPKPTGQPPTEAITLVFLRQAMDQRATRESSITALRNQLHDLPGATLTGMSVLSLDTESTIHRDLPKFITAAVAIIAVYLLLHFRSVSNALLAVLPTAISLICLLVIARLANAKLNLANIVSIPLLIGIDVDYGIFLVSVTRRSKTREDLLNNVAASSQAVLLCAAATFLGFGSLVFTSVPAVRSLGVAVAAGVLACAIAALFVLLPLLLWLRRNSAIKLITLAPLLTLLSLATGCGPPSAHLYFPNQPIEKSAATQWFDLHHSNHPEFGLISNPQGRIDRLLFRDPANTQPDAEYRLADYPNENVPHLILLLDSIPFDTMADRYQAGDFRWFDPPQKMIAPYVSLTEICYTDILHAPPLPGFIDQYYNAVAEKREGTLWNRVWGYQEPWERRLHYHATFAQQALSFIDPNNWFDAELEMARKALDNCPDRVTIVYIASAASVVCKYGKPGAQHVLDGARKLCLQLLYERRGAIKISMMADHGHNYLPSTNLSLDVMLKSSGFTPADSLHADKDCVVEINGLCTCAGIHTRQPAQVAAALTAHPEIELASYNDNDRVIIQGPHGTAAIECHNHRLRYLPITDDVLNYNATIAQLKSTGEMTPDGYTTDEIWFARTLDHLWPNAPRRLWDAHHGKVVHPPTVLLSIKDGFCAGDPSFEKFIKMASTHGGLNQLNSATFVMTMTGRLTKAIRHKDVLQTIEPGIDLRVRQ